jgi:hypothetical protein
MNVFYFYIYLILVAASILTFSIARCFYKMHYFDFLLYPNENNNIFKNPWFLAYHVSVNTLLGLLFGYEVVYAMLIKIIAYEWYMYATEYCDIFNTSKVANLYIVIIISIASYAAGAVFAPFFKTVLNL